MIEVKNLTKKYGELTVYENFNLGIEEGKVTCVLGESGCGKTTLLNCIARLTPYDGYITPDRCSYIFQTPRLVPNLTVGGNLKLICKDEGAIDEILEKTRLSDKKNAYPKALSGGQAQRVALARAFLFGGELILMDEPFSSLDLKLKREISDLFLTVLKESGRTALFVTHDAEEALSLSHRIIVLGCGKIIGDFDNEKSDRDGVRRLLLSALLS